MLRPCLSAVTTAETEQFKEGFELLEFCVPPSEEAPESRADVVLSPHEAKREVEIDTQNSERENVIMLERFNSEKIAVKNSAFAPFEAFLNLPFP